jgi:hypothetical protein
MWREEKMGLIKYARDKLNATRTAYHRRVVVLAADQYRHVAFP